MPSFFRCYADDVIATPPSLMRHTLPRFFAIPLRHATAYYYYVFLPLLIDAADATVYAMPLFFRRHALRHY